MFGLGPIWLFIFEQRLPIGMMRGGLTPWVSSMTTNLAIAWRAALLIWFVGLGAFLIVHLPIVILAGSAGIWLFYVQHQFEETEWAKDDEWEFQHAALHGSSYYDLPPVLRWFTGNIGVHHVHHLSARCRATGCRKCCATIRNCAASAASRSSKACAASSWCCGTRSAAS